MDVSTTNLVLLAVAPGLAIALGFYFVDRYDREPIGLLLKLFFLGVFVTLPTIFLEKLLTRFLPYFDLITDDNAFLIHILKVAWVAFIVAAFSEEFFKRLVVFAVAYRHSAFNEKFDGIIYSVFVALGFATLENILYVVGYRSYEVGISRAVISVPGHMLFAVIMGYYISLAKYATTNKCRRHYFRQSLLMPIIFHGLFDFILMINITWLIPFFIVFLVLLWTVGIKKINEYYKESKERFGK